MEVNPGDKVWYLKESKGGYGYVSHYPAVVIATTPKRVKICLGKVDSEDGTVYPVKRFVNPGSLKEREVRVTFERILTLST